MCSLPTRPLGRRAAVLLWEKGITPRMFESRVLERRVPHLDFSQGLHQQSKGMLDFLSEENTRLCTVRNYYWSEQNKTEKPSDEPPTNQEHRPGVRADQAHRARLIARSTISFGCLSLVKSIFVFVFCFFNRFFLSSCVLLRQHFAACTALHCVENNTSSSDVCL